MPASTAGFALGEMLAVLLARDMADGEKAIVGTNSDIQVAACNLARQRHAPHLWWVSGPGGMTNPTEGVVRPAADAENIAVAQAVMDLPQMIDFIDWKVHFFDFAILGALQTDRFGNINTVCVGEHARPRLRGPGTVGISALCGLSRRFYIMMTRHDRAAPAISRAAARAPISACPRAGPVSPSRRSACSTSSRPARRCASAPCTTA